MSDVTRRTMMGLAAAGAATWTLRAGAAPTPATPAPEHGGPIELTPVAPPAKFQATEDNILGPYFRKNAPYRGKITPPREPGNVLVIQGRIWSMKTRKPIFSATLDIWQANAKGRYDNDDSRNPPRPNVFVNRARLVTDETGYYEYETIRPGQYKIGPNAWRPSHIHYLVQAPGHKPLITQLYFKGDRYNHVDQFIKESLIISPTKRTGTGGEYELGVFDIVLETVS